MNALYGIAHSTHRAQSREVYIIAVNSNPDSNCTFRKSWAVNSILSKAGPGNGPRRSSCAGQNSKNWVASSHDLAPVAPSSKIIRILENFASHSHLPGTSPISVELDGCLRCKQKIHMPEKKQRYCAAHRRSYDENERDWAAWLVRNSYTPNRSPSIYRRKWDNCHQYAIKAAQPSPHQKKPKIPIIQVAYWIEHPGAVMIHVEHLLLSHVIIVSTWCLWIASSVAVHPLIWPALHPSSLGLPGILLTRTALWQARSYVGVPLPHFCIRRYRQRCVRAALQWVLDGMIAPTVQVDHKLFRLFAAQRGSLCVSMLCIVLWIKKCNIVAWVGWECSRSPCLAHEFSVECWICGSGVCADAHGVIEEHVATKKARHEAVKTPWDWPWCAIHRHYKFDAPVHHTGDQTRC